LLKKETRVLGLSGTTIGQKTIIASVVFRGSLWLDGVATTMIEAKERNYNAQLSNFIKNSKQFSQLHAVIISPRLNPKPTSIRDLARRLKLPVIAITQSRRKAKRGDKHLERIAITINGEHVAATTAGVDREQAERLYVISCGTLRHVKVPEAVRIADLLTEKFNTTFG